MEILSLAQKYRWYNDPIARGALGDSTMLDGLEKVDWSKIQNCYGTENQLLIPVWIRNLTSTDAQVRNEALDGLFDHLYHQGMLCEATVYAIPFLLELLALDGVEDKTGILQLLVLFAAMGTHGEVRTAHDKAREGIGVYLTLLNEDDIEVKKYAAYLLSAFPEDATYLVPLMLSQARAEDTAAVKGVLLRSVGVLIAKGDYSEAEKLAFIDVFGKFAEADQDMLVQLAVATSVPVFAHANTPERYVATLLSSIAHQAEYDPLYRQFPYGSSTFMEGISALHKLGIEKGTRTLIQVLQQIQDPSDAHDVAFSLLDLSLKGKDRRVSGLSVDFSRTEGGVKTRTYLRSRYKPQEPERTPADLNPLQREAVMAVLKSDKVWEIPNNMLMLYGFSQSRDEMLKRFEQLQ